MRAARPNVRPALWPKHRILFLLAATSMLIGTVLAARVSRWFALLPGIVGWRVNPGVLMPAANVLTRASRVKSREMSLEIALCDMLAPASTLVRPSTRADAPGRAPAAGCHISRGRRRAAWGCRRGGATVARRQGRPRGHGSSSPECQDKGAACATWL